MFARLLALFIIVPIVELMILIDVGGYVGTGPTILLVVATGALGAYLAKMEGFRILFTIRHKMQTGQLPADELLDGLIILIAGALLLTPGLITDLFGFLMLFRPSRFRFKIWLKSKFSAHINVYNANNPT